MPASASDAFSLLHPAVQKWVWDEGWNQLRDIQADAVHPLKAGNTDVIISAATASGKTEAAFLPICSVLGAEEPTRGIDVIYVSPLKALINDQTARLEQLCERVEVPVFRWHGDVSSSVKARVMKSKGGVLLITPESLEAIFVRRGHEVGQLFQSLKYLVVDELHAFLDNERGRQLQSLMHRVEVVAKHRVPRIGLSATISDHTAAATFLRAEDPQGVLELRSKESGQELRLSLKAYTGSQVTVHDAADDEVNTTVAIAEDLFKTMNGTHSLVFANSRQNVEQLADVLGQMAEARRIPSQYFPHHGNLARDVRDDVEARLGNASTPTTAVATSTLELGIDIGSMQSVAQVGPPPAVSSLRQRLGRAGRRGEPAVLRLYVSEPVVYERSSPVDQLRTPLFETMAMVQLLLQRWYEPPLTHRYDFSTLVQQIMSAIAERGGLRPAQLFSLLCGPGPFGDINAQLFGDLLKDLGQAELIMQSNDMSLLLAPKGERIVNNFEFYTAFITAKEFRLVANGKALGTLPIERPVFPGSLLVFSGRRWQVRNVDDTNKIIELIPAAAGAAPKFGGEGAQLHARVHEEMKRLYQASEVPTYLDPLANRLVTEARSAFGQFDLAYTPLVQFENDTYIFHFSGDRAGATLGIALAQQDIRTLDEGIALVAQRTKLEDVAPVLEDLAKHDAPEPDDLARWVGNKRNAKYDWVLGEDLASLSFASASLDIPGAWSFLRSVHVGG